MPARPAFRQANEADLPVIEEIITAAYRKYLARMDRPPAPMLRDYALPVEQGTVWCTARAAAACARASARRRGPAMGMSNFLDLMSKIAYAHRCQEF